MSATTQFELRNKRVWIAGHRGLVGSALTRRLERENCEVLGVAHSACDLRSRNQLTRWLADARPDVVFMAAAHVGGIFANDACPASFLYDNLMIEANVIDAARHAGVEKLMFLGSSCIYPRAAPQPIAESALLTGPLETTNQWYAVAKIAGIKLCQAYRRQYGCDFISVMPTNLYGPGDNFDLLSSHVVPALLAKADEAKRAGAASLEVWGTGAPRRELMFVDDAADAMVHVMKRYSGEDFVNIGTGEDLTIRELARTVCEVVGFRGDIAFRRDKPDGTPAKTLDVSRLRDLGWAARTKIEEGLQETYRWYLEHRGSLRRSLLANA